ncbi:Centrosomal protein of 44 kDa [Cichlidogyrus casuarinus]|uniref:Centrosomal protein of 44 kDa n=1 Tax=Cichlidogyrus casuarinus TaxID=1844966 RepID=A0ABD2QCL2_9PLAT
MLSAGLINSVECLRRVLRQLRVKRSFDYDGMLAGKAESMVELLRYLLCELDLEIATRLINLGYTFTGLTTARFVDTWYKLMREVLDMRPGLTQIQFNRSAFAERKIQLVAEFASYLVNWPRTDTQIRRKRFATNRMGESVSSTVSTTRHETMTDSVPKTLRSREATNDSHLLQVETEEMQNTQDADLLVSDLAADLSSAESKETSEKTAQSRSNVNWLSCSQEAIPLPPRNHQAPLKSCLISNNNHDSDSLVRSFSRDDHPLVNCRSRSMFMEREKNIEEPWRQGNNNWSVDRNQDIAASTCSLRNDHYATYANRANEEKEFYRMVLEQLKTLSEKVEKIESEVRRNSRLNELPPRFRPQDLAHSYFSMRRYEPYNSWSNKNNHTDRSIGSTYSSKYSRSTRQETKSPVREKNSFEESNQEKSCKLQYDTYAIRNTTGQVSSTYKDQVDRITLMLKESEAALGSSRSKEEKCNESFCKEASFIHTNSVDDDKHIVSPEIAASPREEVVDVNNNNLEPVMSENVLSPKQKAKIITQSSIRREPVQKKSVPLTKPTVRETSSASRNVKISYNKCAILRGQMARPIQQKNASTA